MLIQVGKKVRHYQSYLHVEKDSLGGDKMKKDKKVIFLICLTLGILAYNLFFSAIQLTDYNKRKASGIPTGLWLRKEY